MKQIFTASVMIQAHLCVEADTQADALELIRKRMLAGTVVRAQNGRDFAPMDGPFELTPTVWVDPAMSFDGSTLPTAVAPVTGSPRG